MAKAKRKARMTYKQVKRNIISDQLNINNMSTAEIETVLRMRQHGKDMEQAALFGKSVVDNAKEFQGLATKAVASDPNRRHTSRRAPSTILETAQSLIYGARNKTYRHPTENFENIANLWNAYFHAIKVRPGVVYDNVDSINHGAFHINRIDVAYMNILQKIARGATNQEHEDTIVDIAGYAGCIERIVKNK